MRTASINAANPSILLRNRHFQTIFASTARASHPPNFERRRLELSDGDFLDLDLLLDRNPRLAILSHGLEGSSRARYICALASLLNQNKWDVLAWNYRGCSGEPNRLESLYHSGKTEDLDAVVRYALETINPRAIALIGFSIGGNITLKYLGESADRLSSQICAAVAISVPIDLKSCALLLERGFNKLYTFEFLRSLQAKIRAKRLQGSNIPDFSLRTIRTMKDYDQLYTAPLHGFADAEDYYRRASSRNYIAEIRVPSLIINALDDPFLSPSGELIELVKKSSSIALDLPKFGGHNGFLYTFSDKISWSEWRCFEFINKVCA